MQMRKLHIKFNYFRSDFLKGNAFFVIDFPYYNIAHFTIKRSRFIHNKGSWMWYKTWSVARRHKIWNEKCEGT